MVDYPIPYNQEADDAVAFIKQLTHSKGRWARQPFQLHQWQENIVRLIFGTLRPDGLRQFRTVFITLPRKNGKTELAAAIALKCLIGEAEMGGEGYSGACNREQASLVFKPCAAMIRADAELSRVCNITDSQRLITFQPTGSTYRAIPADAPSAHGYNASFFIGDEIHAWPHRDLWDVMTTSSGTREQPLTLAITTAGHDRTSFCWTLYDYAVKVRDGIIDDPSFLPIIYEAPIDADWTDEAVWHAANPALASGFRNLDEMRQMFREAKQNGARETVFRQLYLNQWTESISRWISTDAWNACGRDYTAADLEGQDCFAAVDLAYRSDYAALVFCFPEADGTYRLLPYFWLPEEGSRDLTHPQFSRWAKDGLVTLTPGNSTDFGAIRKFINEAGQRFRIREIAVDPWNARQFASELIDDGFEVFEFAQNLRTFNEPTKLFESLVMGQKLLHPKHAILTWMMSNVAIESDASGNYRPSKKKSSEKIDGAVASIMALGRATMQPVDSDAWYTPGILTDNAITGFNF